MKKYKIFSSILNKKIWVPKYVSYWQEREQLKNRIHNEKIKKKNLQFLFIYKNNLYSFCPFDNQKFKKQNFKHKNC